MSHLIVISTNGDIENGVTKKVGYDINQFVKL